MSQPPSPYSRSYSFTAWKVSNPNDPLPGNNVDQQLDYIATSLNATISRLGEIQSDDGKIRQSSLPGVLANATAYVDAAAQAAATQAATDLYATNLSLVANKAEARANLELNQYYPLLAGDNLFIESQTVKQYDRPFVAGVEQATQHINGKTHYFLGPLPTSSYSSRKFRSAILFGTLQDTATNFAGSSAFSDISYRVDNLSFALMYAGTIPYWNGSGYRSYFNPGTGVSPYINTTISTGESGPSYQRTLLAKEDYSQLGNLPSIGNPLVSLRQLGDAMSTHETWYNHTNIPNNAQKATLNSITQSGNVINNGSGYASGSFNSTYYPKEIKIVINGTTYAVPAHIVT